MKNRNIAEKLILVTAFVVIYFFSYSQSSLTFVQLSDIHVGSNTAADDLRRTVADINQNPLIQFVIITGDITEFGSDEQLLAARQILDSLNKPWHIIPGNHDSNWSESGANSFKRIFGNETFAFSANGYLFLGTHSGPNMRMSPGQIPRENIVWLDSVLRKTDTVTPIIWVNHYPLDSSLNNWYEAVDLLKTRNVQLALCGHGHTNRQLNFEGIPGIMGRSNLRAKNEEGGYNIATIENGGITYVERNPLSHNERQWAHVSLQNHHFSQDITSWYRPSFAVNQKYPMVRTKWQFSDNSDIGSGVALGGKTVFASNTAGEIYALHVKSGKKIWTFRTGGKVYSTPAFANRKVVAASTDRFIYCLDARSGRQLWKVETEKPNVANAVIRDGIVYIGSSDGKFRAIDLENGDLKWQFDGVKGFVVTTPLIYAGNVYFGSWGTEFYALNAANGILQWTWNNGSPNTMFSPAACYPVATGNKIFIVAPDRYMTVLDAATGKQVWRKRDPQYRVRESMGMSKDSSLIYAKTMDGQLIGVSTKAGDMEVTWNSATNLNYEIAPTAIVEAEQIVYTPSNSGVVTASLRKDGKVLWQHKISNALVTSITPLGHNRIIVTTMDGKLTRLDF